LRLKNPDKHRTSAAAGIRDPQFTQRAGTMYDSSMNIIPSLFEAFLKCPAKCRLRFTCEPPTGNPYAEWVQTIAGNLAGG
jgi:hypothetical protein